jgi:carbamoyl-phosphate synthase/aspartate carbamoyltransferase/dihydroorotase
MYQNPRRIFNLPEQSETWIEVDLNAKHTISASNSFSKCGWTPFEGWEVQGRIERVVLRGQTAFESGQVIAQPGYGLDLRTV